MPPGEVSVRERAGVTLSSADRADALIDHADKGRWENWGRDDFSLGESGETVAHTDAAS